MASPFYGVYVMIYRLELHDLKTGRGLRDPPFVRSIPLVEVEGSELVKVTQQVNSYTQ